MSKNLVYIVTFYDEINDSQKEGWEPENSVTETEPDVTKRKGK